MTSKTIVATGASSGLGLEVVKQLLQQSTTPHRFVLGCRDTTATESAYEAIKYDDKKHSVSILPLNLSNLKSVKSFAHESLQQVGSNKLDYVLLNAGMSKDANELGPNGSQWCEPLVVNHLSQHYLLQLMREKIAESHSRLVFVSSGAIRGKRNTSELSSILKAQSGAKSQTVYSSSKFVQMLGAQYWRRQLGDQASVIAVSPGLIPNTGIMRHNDYELTSDMPDAKTVPEGARSIINAFDRSDFPEDPNCIALASWGEWWEGDTYSAAFDEKLQDSWCPSKEQIESDNGL